MKYVLCSVRKGSTNNMMEEKWLCELLHIASLLNSENPIQMQPETFIKHVLPAKVRAINHLKNTNHRTGKRQKWGGGGLMGKNFCVSTRSRTWHLLYDNQWIHYLTMPYWILKIQISSLHSMFLASIHITVLINYIRLNCRIKFYLKTNNAFMHQSTHKMANRNQNEIQAVLCLKKQYKHDGEKMAM